jgi:hypothetical protein
MKPKQFSKKLMLNKQTVAHLGNKEMSAAHGGTGDTAVAGCVRPPTFDPCITFGLYSCPTICYTVSPGGVCNPWAC